MDSPFISMKEVKPYMRTSRSTSPIEITRAVLREGESRVHERWNLNRTIPIQDLLSFIKTSLLIWNPTFQKQVDKRNTFGVTYITGCYALDRWNVYTHLELFHISRWYCLHLSPSLSMSVHFCATQHAGVLYLAMVTDNRITATSVLDCLPRRTLSSSEITHYQCTKFTWQVSQKSGEHNNITFS